MSDIQSGEPWTVTRPKINKAIKWAAAPIDEVVESGLYSARHYANAAGTSATNAGASAVAAAGSAATANTKAGEAATSASNAAASATAAAANTKFHVRGSTPLSGVAFSAGVIRRATSLDNWSFISDANHGNFGFQSIAVENNEIVLTYVTQPTQNMTVFAVPDETFACMGITVGASSGVGPSATLRLSMASSASVRLAMTSTPSFVSGNSAHTDEMQVHWCLASYTLSGMTGAPTVGMVVTAGGISCTVTYVSGTRMDVAGRNNATDRYRPLPDTGTVTGTGFSATIASRSIVKGFVIRHLPLFNNNSPTATYDASVHPDVIQDLAVHQFSSSETRILPYGELDTQIIFDGTNWVTAQGRDRAQNGANALSFVWNSGQNALDITHPDILSAGTARVESKVANVAVRTSEVTATSARVQFLNALTGAILNPTTDAASNFNFYLDRGAMRLYDPWTGHVRVNFPVMQLNPARVSNSIANIWIGAFHNEPPPTL